MELIDPIIQNYVYTKNHGGSGLPISKIVVSESTRNGGGDALTKRISDLAVPSGLVVIDDKPSHTITYKSSQPPQTSNVIPDDLYDKLLGMVESNSSSKTKSKYSRKISKSIPKTKVQTKRIRIKPDL